MFASDQNLLLQPEVNPAVGLRYLERCVQLAGAWRKLGGNVTLVHDDLPARLVRQMKRQSIEWLPLANVDRVAATMKPGWLFVDGASGQPSVECSNAGTGSDLRWKLAATWTWAEANGTRFQSPDLLIATDPKRLDNRFLRSERILRGAHYQLPASDGLLRKSQSEASTIPSVARKILIWLSDEDSKAGVAETLADVIDVASERTSVDVVASLQLRDSVAMRQLKKANPQITIRYWSSIERRFQSMAPIHLGIVDCDEKKQALAVRGIPIVRLDGAHGGEDAFERQSSAANNFLMDSTSRAAFRRSLSRLIRNRTYREGLIHSNPGHRDDQAPDRIARSLATADLRLESATLEDWSEVSRWQDEPESFASALPCWNRDAEADRNEFAAALERSSSSRWMFRMACGMPIGMASFEPCERTGDRSGRVRVIVKPSFRNQGYGTALLERVLEKAWGDGHVQQIIVQARSTHQAAGRMAVKAGLLPMAPAVIDGVVADQFGFQFDRAMPRSTDPIPMQRSA